MQNLTRTSDIVRGHQEVIISEDHGIAQITLVILDIFFPYCSLNSHKYIISISPLLYV